MREDGWRHVKHQGVTEDLVVRLERPLAVRLVRPAGRSAELGDLYLYVEPVDRRGAPSVGERDWTLSADEAAVEVGLSEPGTYRVLWAASVDLGGRWKSNVYPRDVVPQVFEVPERAGTVEVRLTLDSDAVDELLARVQALTDELGRRPGESDDEHEGRAIEAIRRDSRRR